MAEEAEHQQKKAAKPKKKAAPKRRAVATSYGNAHKLFNKYDYNVEVLDLSLKNYINLKPEEFPSSYRSTSSKMFSKANINIVERLENALMRGGTGKKVGGRVIRTEGRLQGKKLKVMHIVESAFDMVNETTKKNPLEVFIRALENSAPIEDTTRIRQGGTVSNIPVDISASRRLDTALRNISTASIIGAFNNKKSISEALANEMILAANNDINSYALKRKNEIERMARSAK
ncbi:MAG: 30S ribosomal protein S7 [Candidatus Marsarchaeota archaeon]|nr:30S ribosomal protein S7 [Candidatus Marsarchaeota archaeon]